MNTKTTPSTEVMPAEAGMPHGASAPARMVNAASQVRPLQLNDMSEMWRFAQAIVRADLLPKSYGGGDAEAKASKALIALQLGAEVGLMPMQSIQSIYVVNGIPTLYGDSQLALVRQSGMMEYIKEWVEGEVPDLVCHCEVKRRGDAEAIKRSFSWKDAQQANLAGKDTYKGHPKRMCAYRARAYALRDTFPDVLKGLTHTYEEMIDVTPARPEQTGATQSMADLLAEETAAAGAKDVATETVAEPVNEDAAVPADTDTALHAEDAPAKT